MVALEHSSVASFLVWEGEGGKTPKCTDRRKKKKNHVHVTHMRERAPQKHTCSNVSTKLPKTLWGRGGGGLPAPPHLATLVVEHVKIM